MSEFDINEINEVIGATSLRANTNRAHKNVTEYRFHLNSPILLKLVDIRARDAFARPSEFRARADLAILEPEKNWSELDRVIACGLFLSILQKTPTMKPFNLSVSFRMRLAKEVPGKQSVTSMLYGYMYYQTQSILIFKKESFDSTLPTDALLTFSTTEPATAALHRITINSSSQLIQLLESWLDDPHCARQAKEFCDIHNASLESADSMLSFSKSNLEQRQILMVIALFDHLIPVIMVNK